MITGVKNFLSKKSIIVPENWIPACVDFITSEHGSENIRNQTWLNEKVYEQWLHSDLTELGVFSLPNDISKELSIIIEGEHALQINFIKDIGMPAYSQLQKLRKDDIENSSISAEKQFVSSWEPKPSRVLMLQLTDGLNVLYGMEYSFIPQLSLSLKPGTKILLKGRIECRRGVLLLRQSNVMIFGGEIDSLAVTNALENVLNRTLGIKETDEPMTVPESFNLQTENSFMQSDVSQNIQPSIYTKSRPFESKSNSLKNMITSNINMDYNNEFDDDFDDDTDLALLEAERNLTLQNSNKYYKTPKILAGDNTTSDIHDKFSEKPNLHSSDNLSDIEDDDLLMAAEMYSTSSSIPSVEVFKDYNKASKINFNSCIEERKDQLYHNDNDIFNFNNGTTNKVNNLPHKIIKPNLNSIKRQREDESDPSEVFNNTRQVENKTSLYTNEYSINNYKKPQLNYQNNKIIKKDFTKYINEMPPYQYICSLNLKPIKKTTFIIKGFFLTLLSKLEQKDGKWNLMAKVNDGTGSCNVFIDNEVLQKLIGLSVSEFQLKKEEAKLNLELRNSIAQCVIKCQKELINVCSLLRIEVGPHLEIPYVKEIIPLTYSHFLQLKASVQ